MGYNFVFRLMSSSRLVRWAHRIENAYFTDMTINQHYDADLFFVGYASAPLVEGVGALQQCFGSISNRIQERSYADCKIPTLVVP